ncbi:MAG: MFS transporter [Hyphomicrobiaceae bacterium]|nr:MFS transporter [Hyphomicrobiaceae bacterium]
MHIAHYALLFVVFLDLMSQGLVIPVLTTILLNPDQGFLPAHTTTAARQFDYGLVMAVFFLSWFLGAAYISKLSDSLGRKTGILICLSGNLVGYILTILALQSDSLALLVVARAISGFTAGNQPIAQAALVDLSKSDEQKTRFFGYVLAAVSISLVVGPLMGGALSDKAVLGQYASLELPFYAVSVLVLINIAMIVFFFHEADFKREPVRIRPVEVFLTLWEVAKRPVVLRLSLVFFFAQLTLNSYYVFMDNYFFSRFHFDTLQNAMTLVVLGVSMGFASTFLVSPVNKRYDKAAIILVCQVVMAVGIGLTIINPSPFIAYLLIVPIFIAFGIYYPTIVTMFSLSVGPKEQGWIMGVTVALYTLGSGLISVIGGKLMAVDIILPFVMALVAALIAAGLIFLLWRGEDIRKIAAK